VNLTTTFDGLSLDNPLMPASGPLVGDAEKLLWLQDAGVGALVTKTISAKLPVIPKPCIYGDKDFVMNSELWSEHPYQTWVDDFLPRLVQAKTRPLIVSVGYSKEDMELLIPLLDPFADAFEVSTHYVGSNLDTISNIVKAIRARTKKPIYMKISPHIPSPALFAKAISEAGASGVVAVNSLGPTLKIDLANRQIQYAGDSGFVWMSGPAIKPVALATVYKIKQAAPHLTVIGVGGIKSADDVLEFLLAGASGVQMLSAALLKGKSLYAKIIQDLPLALTRYGFSSMEEVIQTGLKNHVDYEGVVPTLLNDKCIQCMLCKDVCPYHAITFPGIITVKPELCFRCGLCVSKCPTKALQGAYR
jgi:dihydroorotate dehydrogenase subfamily 1